jgi:hypothetical protein
MLLLYQEEIIHIWHLFFDCQYNSHTLYSHSPSTYSLRPQKAPSPKGCRPNILPACRIWELIGKWKRVMLCKFLWLVGWVIVLLWLIWIFQNGVVFNRYIEEETVFHCLYVHQLASWLYKIYFNDNKIWRRWQLVPRSHNRLPGVYVYVTLLVATANMLGIRMCFLVNRWSVVGATTFWSLFILSF